MTANVYKKLHEKFSKELTPDLVQGAICECCARCGRNKTGTGLCRIGKGQCDGRSLFLQKDTTGAELCFRVHDIIQRHRQAAA